jgi:hypothetical protein
MQVQSYGFRLIISTNLDLSTTESVRIDLLKPDGVESSQTLLPVDFVPPAAPDTTWLIRVPVPEGMLSIPGTYKIQATDTTPGRNMPCSVGKFNVLPNIIPTV